jgi:hypothetical protein
VDLAQAAALIEESNLYSHFSLATKRRTVHSESPSLHDHPKKEVQGQSIDTIPTIATDEAMFLNRFMKKPIRELIFCWLSFFSPGHCTKVIGPDHN